MLAGTSKLELFPIDNQYSFTGGTEQNQRNRLIMESNSVQKYKEARKKEPVTARPSIFPFS